MNEWPTVWLAVIAISVLVMAVVQVAVVVAAAIYARQAAASVAELRREIGPLLERAHQISDDAARVTALAVGQVERLDRLVASATQRFDDTMGLVHGAIVEPVRQGAAVMAALRAGWSVFAGRSARRDHRDAPDRHRTHRDEDEALFVG